MSRRGYTLIETLAVITVGSVMFSIAVGVLYALLGAERTGHQRVYQTRVLAQLAEQFRADVATAVRQIPVQGSQPTQWQFAMTDDRTVTYRTSPGNVQREEDAVGKRVRQESYLLPAGCSATISVENDAKSTLVSLVVTGSAHGASGLTSAGREWRVTGLLGKDHRFTKPPSGGK